MISVIAKENELPLPIVPVVDVQSLKERIIDFDKEKNRVRVDLPFIKDSKSQKGSSLFSKLLGSKKKKD